MSRLQEITSFSTIPWLAPDLRNYMKNYFSTQCVEAIKWRAILESPIFVCFLAVLVFKLGVEIFNYSFHLNPMVPLLIFLPVLYVCRSMKSADLIKPLRIIFYANLGLLSFYMLTTTEAFYPKNEFQSFLMNVLSVYRIVGFAFTILAFWKPVYGLIVFAFLPFRWHLIKLITGITESERVDWVVCAEMGCYILACFFVYKLFVMVKKREIKYGVSSLGVVVFISSISIHFANYFFSGLRKIVLDGGPLSWFLENPTYEWISFAIHRSHFPATLLSEPALVSVRSIFEMFVVPSNIFVLVTQLLAIFGLSRIRLAIVLTLSYDLMHIAIFLVSGIFFWKWIFLNLFIIWALREYLPRKIAVSESLWSIFLIGISPLFFSVAFLGWYDSHAAKISLVYAHFKDGRVMQVPTNYFMSHSFRWVFAFDNALDGGFPIIWGQGTNKKGGYDLVLNSKDCDIEVGHKGVNPDHERGINSALEFIPMYHEYVVDHLDGNGYFNYDFYPHHVWSNPWSFKEFKQADKRDIVGYELVNESICYRYIGEKYDPIVKFRDSRYVSVTAKE